MFNGGKMATERKFVKAKKAAVKVHLGPASRIKEKEVKLVISLPEEVALNLFRRLKKRFSN
jgi:hypothetical protein